MIDREAVAQPVDYDFPLIPKDTDDALDSAHARARPDYETWKRQFVDWLYHEGRNPARLRGYAGETHGRLSSAHVDSTGRHTFAASSVDRVRNCGFSTE